MCFSEIATDALSEKIILTFYISVCEKSALQDQNGKLSFTAGQHECSFGTKAVLLCIFMTSPLTIQSHTKFST